MNFIAQIAHSKILPFTDSKIVNFGVKRQLKVHNVFFLQYLSFLSYITTHLTV